LKSSVLIVDDKIHATFILRRQFSNWGLSVFVACGRDVIPIVMRCVPISLVCRPSRWDNVPDHPLLRYINENLSAHKVMSYGDELWSSNYSEPQRRHAQKTMGAVIQQAC